MPRETLHAPLTPDSSISAVFCVKPVRWPPCLLSLTFLFFSYTRIGATAHMGPANCQHACWLHPQQHDSAEKSSLRKRRTYERRADTGSMLKWYPKDAQWGESAPQLKPKGGPADLTHLYYTTPPPPPQNTTSMHARNYSSPTHHRGIWSSVHSGTFTPAGARGAPDGEPQGFNETAVQWKSRYRRQHTGHGSFQRVPVLMCHTVNSGSLSLPELSAAWSKHRGQADRGRVAFKIKA